MDAPTGHPGAPAARRWSSRVRIVLWLLFLVGAILAANLLVTSRLLQARVEERALDELAHEYDKLAAFVQRTGGDHADAQALLTAYLGSSFPEEGESYFTIVDGRPGRRSANTTPGRLDLDTDFVQLVAPLDEPRIGAWNTPEVELRYGVFPVEVPGGLPASLVVSEVVDRAAAEASIGMLSAVSLGALAAAGVVSWFVAGRLLGPIQAVSDTAERISESDLTQRIEVHGNDDVAELARTFNRMLDRIEDAFEGQRRFFDDVGHELRTPLTVVRGQLEVMETDPTERERVFPLVIAELERMGRLVGDLLVLARSERPDFLYVGEVDLADLTVEVLAKSRTLGDRRWTLSELADVTVTVDGQRLTQALMQLVANAITHTSDGDGIDVGSAVRGPWVELWVTDTGTGIRVEDRERIFDRLVTTGHEGAGGLGLAIVRSIAEAHGGTASVDGEVGVGSTFTLRLPSTCVVTNHSHENDDVDPNQDHGGDEKQQRSPSTPTAIPGKTTEEHPWLTS